MDSAKVFMTGRSQAVRLPKAYRFDSEEVLIERRARSEGDLLGRTGGNKVVAFVGDPSRVGGYATVSLVSTSGATFRGELVA